MDKKNIKHPHIGIEGKEKEFELGYGRGGKKLEAGGLSNQSFKNKLNSVLDIDDLRAKFDNKYFFEIKLRVDYFSPIAQDLFKKLGIDVRSVFDEKRLIVSGDRDTIIKFKNKSQINKEILKAIEDIKILDTQNKIGESIKRIWDSEKDFKVEIGFIEHLTQSELSKFQNRIKEFGGNLSMGKYTASAIMVVSKQQLEKLSEFPIVKKISKLAKWKGTAVAKGSTIKTNLKITKPDNERPKICVIDTGISQKLKDFCEATTSITTSPYDSNDHGTAVASLCMFNKNELSNSNRLNADVGIISHKISETSQNDEINFFDELISAIETHKDKTRIFCFSWNCLNYEDTLYEDRVRELDLYLQKNNIMLINSSGNIDSALLPSLFPQYPNYMLVNPVMTPSESKYTYSVGAIHRHPTRNLVLSSLGRVFLPMNAINLLEDRHIRIKPEVFADGGFVEFDSSGEIRRGVVCLGCDCLKTEFVGTSLSAPQVARIATILQNHYKYKNVETLKATIFLKCNDFEQKLNRGLDIDKFFGKSLEGEEEILDSDDGFYFFTEGFTKLRERIKQNKKDKVIGTNFQIPVTKEIEYMEIAVCHSNNNPFETIRNFSTRLVTPIYKPGRKGPLSKNWEGGYGTIGKKAPLTFGKYKYTRGTPEGMWDIKIYVDESGVPEEVRKNIEVRYGIAVKLKIKRDFLGRKDEIYQKLKDMLYPKDTNEVEIIEEIEESFKDIAQASATQT